VALDFNTTTLQPTYSLRWGAAGSSNALDIAQALGFDARVLADARILARAELGKQEQQRGRMEQVCGRVPLVGLWCVALRTPFARVGRAAAPPLCVALCARGAPRHAARTHARRARRWPRRWRTSWPLRAPAWQR
jgi:hypothetical protein